MDRTDTIAALRGEGHTLGEIGTSVGLTAERVRQLLAQQGLRTMTRADKIAAAAAAWRATGELRHVADVANEHGLAPHSSTLAELRRACPDLALPDVKPAGSRWDEHTVARILRRMALEHGIDPATGWMRITDYGMWRREGDPSTASIGANYTWSVLMTLAGFDVKNAGHRGRQPGIGYQAFTDADLDAAVLAYLDSEPTRISGASMERFLMNTPGLPSLATIRNRFRKRGIHAISAIITDVRARAE